MDCRKDKGQNKFAGRLDFLIVLSKDAILRQANHYASAMYSDQVASFVCLLGEISKHCEAHRCLRPYADKGQSRQGVFGLMVVLFWCSIWR